MNPIYVAPSANDPWPLDAERRYHVANIRLLSLYFDAIVIMAGNLMNYPNHTTRAVILAVTSDSSFRCLVEAGAIVFCGWGADTAAGMIQNQVAYARTHRAELKDEAAMSQVRSLMGAGEMFQRETGSGEADFIQTFAERMSIRSERDPSDAWPRVEEASVSVQEQVGYLGSLELFPALSQFHPTVRRAVHETYFDSWIDYAASRYTPIVCYESPRLLLNRFRTPPQMSSAMPIASMLLSPQYFHRFLRTFLSDRQLYRLLSMDPDRLVRLRNGDWTVFCHHYHAQIEAASEVFWRLHLSLPESLSRPADEVFDAILADAFKRWPSASHVAFFTGFLSQAAGVLAATPGLASLTRAIVKPFEQYLASRFGRISTEIMSAGAYPFIAKLRAAATG
jgi:hypothetical protein